jgi:Zn finger protein HypA/HybF involved in hydrogenase expression
MRMIKKPKGRGKGERIGQLKKCEWCNQYLPNERYHLRICPDCRKTTLQAFKKEVL